MGIEVDDVVVSRFALQVFGQGLERAGAQDLHLYPQLHPVDGLNQRAGNGAIAYVGFLIRAGGNHQQVNHRAGYSVNVGGAPSAEPLAGKDCLYGQGGGMVGVFQRLPVQGLEVGRIALNFDLELA